MRVRILLIANPQKSRKKHNYMLRIVFPTKNSRQGGNKICAQNSGLEICLPQGHVSSSLPHDKTHDVRLPVPPCIPPLPRPPRSSARRRGCSRAWRWKCGTPPGPGILFKFKTVLFVWEFDCFGTCLALFLSDLLSLCSVALTIGSQGAPWSRVGRSAQDCFFKDFFQKKLMGNKLIFTTSTTSTSLAVFPPPPSSSSFGSSWREKVTEASGAAEEADGVRGFLEPGNSNSNMQ